VTRPGDDHDLERLLRRLGEVTPSSGRSVDDALAEVGVRVRRRQLTQRAATGALAVVAAAALVAVPTAVVNLHGHHKAVLAATATPTPPVGSPVASSHPSPHPTRPGPSADSSPPAPSGPHRTGGTVYQPVVGPRLTSADVDALGCPVQWGAVPTRFWVPEAGPAGALVPLSPSRLVVCGYPAAGAGPGKIAAEQSVHHGFNALARALTGAASGRLTACPPGSGLDDLLVRADYPDGTVAWVAAVDSAHGCSGATNGRFSSPLALGPPLAAALANEGSYGRAYPGDCSLSYSRPGRDVALVPHADGDDPVLAYLCVTDPGDGQRGETTLDEGAAPGGVSLSTLVADLDALSTGSASATCASSTSPPGPTYSLVIVYAGGENLGIVVQPGCDNGVTNGILTATPSQQLLDDLGAASTG
jgi:hypothetical protein